MKEKKWEHVHINNELWDTSDNNYTHVNFSILHLSKLNNICWKIHSEEQKEHNYLDFPYLKLCFLVIFESLFFYCSSDIGHFKNKIEKDSKNYCWADRCNVIQNTVQLLAHEYTKGIFYEICGQNDQGWCIESRKTEFKDENTYCSCGNNHCHNIGNVVQIVVLVCFGCH